MINIAEKISTKYHDFGLLLLDDRNGTRVRNMELKYNQDAERINKEILQEWATGRGKKPVSWKTPHYTSLVSPSLARPQVNAVEFATKVYVLALQWLRGNSATDIGVQNVTPQKLSAYR